MAVGRHLGFYRTGNSAIRSADAENPWTESYMEWIECTICEIFTFKLYRGLETKVRGNSWSSKAALFDRAHTNLYSVFHNKYAFIWYFIYYRFQDIAAYWLKIATSRCIRCPR